MKYFVEIAYHGAAFAGWQIQPEQTTVQDTIQKGLSTICNTAIEIVGCGRTDAGVHASQYYFHFEVAQDLDPNKFVFQLNGVVGHAISILRLIPVQEDAHARFDASKRSYSYYMHGKKNPFLRDRSYFHPMMHKLDIDRLQVAADLIKNYDAFFPFCKSKTQVQTMQCRIYKSQWKQDENGFVYQVSADRFLRGMVRLIVGMCINVASDKLDIQTVKDALEKQERFTPALSVPAQGLFLDQVEYSSMFDYSTS